MQTQTRFKIFSFTISIVCCCFAATHIFIHVLLWITYVSSSEQLIRVIVVFILTWTLNAICAGIFFISMLLPWRMLPFLESCISGEIWQSDYSVFALRAISLLSLCQSIFDLFTLPFFCLGLCSLVRAPLVLRALTLKFPVEFVDFSCWSISRRCMIINHGMKSITNVLVLPFAFVAFVIPTCTWEVVRGSCQLMNRWWSSGFGDTPELNDGRFLDSLVIFYAWQFVYACGDCVFLPLGLVFALCVPTRAWVFFGHWAWLCEDDQLVTWFHRDQHNVSGEANLACLHTRIKNKNRARLYGLCGHTVCLALRDVGALVLSCLTLVASPMAAYELLSGSYNLVRLWCRGGISSATVRATATGAGHSAAVVGTGVDLNFEDRAAAYEELTEQLSWLALSRCIAATGDLLMMPFGLVSICCPTRSLNFCRSLRRLMLARDPAPLVTVVNMVETNSNESQFMFCLVVPRGEFCKLCLSHCLYSFGDLFFALPLGAIACLVPSRTRPLCAALVAATQDPPRCSNALEWPLPGEQWAICAFK